MALPSSFILAAAALAVALAALALALRPDIRRLYRAVPWVRRRINRSLEAWAREAIDDALAEPPFAPRPGSPRARPSESEAS